MHVQTCIESFVRSKRVCIVMLLCLARLIHVDKLRIQAIPNLLHSDTPI